jgi:ferredoxin--NADP+ reductase
VFVAAGTGLAPFVSMVRGAVRAGDAGSLGRTAVLHGVSHPNELAYGDVLLDAAQRFGLRYVPTVSRPAEHPEWAGRVGRVEYLLRHDVTHGVEAELGVDMHPERAVAYVCGFRGTIAETVRSLLRRGFTPEDRRLRRLLELPDASAPSLFFEQYDLEPVFDPADAGAIAALRAEINRGT